MTDTTKPDATDESRTPIGLREMTLSEEAARQLMEISMAAAPPATRDRLTGDNAPGKELPDEPGYYFCDPKDAHCDPYLMWWSGKKLFYLDPTGDASGESQLEGFSHFCGPLVPSSTIATLQQQLAGVTKELDTAQQACAAYRALLVTENDWQSFREEFLQDNVSGRNYQKLQQWLNENGAEEVGRKWYDQLIAVTAQLAEKDAEIAEAKANLADCMKAARAWTALMNGIEAIRELDTFDELTPDQQKLDAYIQSWTKMKERAETAESKLAELRAKVEGVK